MSGTRALWYEESEDRKNNFAVCLGRVNKKQPKLKLLVHY